MLVAIKKREDLENLEELDSLKYQVEELHLQQKLSKQNFHENVKKLQEPLFATIKDTSESLTRTFT